MVLQMIELSGTACLVGFAGDALLQIGSKMGLGGPTGWGLTEYFQQHGSQESLYIAGGMMTLFYTLYLLTGLPLRYDYLALYGVILDFIFRKLMPFKSLTGYYNHLNYFWSAVWGAIPLMLPFFVYQVTWGAA
jgi:hypothetical protein